MDKLTSVKLSASSDFNTSGKQFVARVTGRGSKFPLAFEFIGRKSGKRGDVTSENVDIEGLYVEHDVTRKGATDTYIIVWYDGIDLCRTDTVSYDDALALAKDLTVANLRKVGRQLEIEYLEHMLARDLDPAKLDETVSFDLRLGTVPPGTYTRRERIEQRKQELARLRNEPVIDRPLDLTGGPTEPDAARRLLETEKAQLLARLAEIDAELSR